jgi:hypothetical protein
VSRERKRERDTEREREKTEREKKLKKNELPPNKFKNKKIRKIPCQKNKKIRKIPCQKNKKNTPPVTGYFSYFVKKNKKIPLR